MVSFIKTLFALTHICVSFPMTSSQNEDYKISSMDGEFTMEVSRENQEVKIAVAFRETCWFEAVKTWLFSSGLFARRYVDNRIVLGLEGFPNDPLNRMLLDPLFYGEPVVLEPTGDHKFLGFVINPQLRALTYVQPERADQFRTSASTG